MGESDLGKLPSLHIATAVFPGATHLLSNPTSARFPTPSSVFNSDITLILGTLTLQNPSLNSLFTPLTHYSLTANNQDRPGIEHEREKHKQDSVQKAKDGKGEWKEELASDSEETVAASKSDHSMEEMQKMGSQKGEKDNKPS